MPNGKRIDAVVAKLPPDKHNTLHSFCREYGIYDDNATELLLALVLLEVDDILKRIPAEMRHEVALAKEEINAIPALINQAIDDRLQSETDTLTAAVQAATLSARGQIDDLKHTLQGRVAVAVNAAVEPTLAELERILGATKDSVRKAGEWQISAWREQEQAVQAGLKELTAKIALINRITAEDKQAVVQALADWHRTFAAALATSGTDAVAQFDAKITTAGADLLAKTTTALKDAENGQSALAKKYLGALKKQEEVLSRANRFGLAVLVGFAVAFLAGGFLAASWWQADTYQTNLSRTIQLYESKLPPGQQVLPASVVGDAAKLRAYLDAHAPRGGR